MPKTTVAKGGSVAPLPAAPPPPRDEYLCAKAANAEAARVGRSPHVADVQLVRDYEGHRAVGQAAYDQAVTRIAARKAAGQPVDQHDVARVAQFDRWARDSGL